MHHRFLCGVALRKIIDYAKTGSIDDLIVQQNKWNLTELYKDYPKYVERIGSKGTEKRLTTPIFSSLEVFTDERRPGDVRILGLINNKRYYKYVERRYLENNHGNIDCYKVILPASNGAGVLGEALSSPVIGKPGDGYTQSFIGIGSFGTLSEAEAVLKYVKTKLARTLLGILKITQHNHKGTWRYIPLQDFTPASDIDWSKSIPEIDQQLYAKYGLDESEIAFIESHVKEMS